MGKGPQLGETVLVPGGEAGAGRKKEDRNRKGASLEDPCDYLGQSGCGKCQEAGSALCFDYQSILPCLYLKTYLFYLLEMRKRLLQD